MSKNININVHHLTRVEGHGNIVVNIKDGTIEKCEWQVPEAPRFFEAMVRGRRYDDIQTIVSAVSAGSARSRIRWSRPRPSKMHWGWRSPNRSTWSVT